MEGAYDSTIIPDHPNKIEVWEPDDLRTVAWRVSAIADSLGGREQTDLEEAVAALFSAAEQLERV